MSIQSLQFEDISRQILEKSQQDLEGLRTVVQSVREQAAKPVASAPSATHSEQASTDSLTALAQTLVLEQETNAQHKPAQDSVNAGEIELF